jgi:hypothetical protein
MDKRTSDREVTDLTVPANMQAFEYNVVVASLSTEGCMIEAGPLFLHQVSRGIPHRHRIAATTQQQAEFSSEDIDAALTDLRRIPLSKRARTKSRPPGLRLLPFCRFL